MTSTTRSALAGLLLLTLTACGPTGGKHAAPAAQAARPTAAASASASAGTTPSASTPASASASASATATAPSTVATTTAADRASTGSPSPSASTSETTVPSTPSTPTPPPVLVPQVFPVSGSTVGIGQVVDVVLPASVSDRATAQRRLSVTTEPEVVGAWAWLSNRHVQWRPKEFWPTGTKVTVTVLASDDTPRTTRFRIGRAVTVRADAGTHKATVTVDGKVFGTYPVSFGSPEWPTRHGTMVVLAKAQNFRFQSENFNGDTGGETWDLVSPYAIRLTWSGTFLHAAPWNKHVGTADTSHGCVHFNTADIGKFYGLIKPGDVVTISGTRGRPQGLTNGYGAWNLSWAQWQAMGVKG
ncbi:MAG: L,D-transpeptidase [Motilibacteraceae bacterium]